VPCHMLRNLCRHHKIGLSTHFAITLRPVIS
jgi:hypothetical protein